MIKGLHIKIWINKCYHIKWQRRGYGRVNENETAECALRMKGCGGRTIHGGYRLIYSGEDSGRHWVTFLVSPDIAQCVEKVICKKHRIISIDFKLGSLALSKSMNHNKADQQGKRINFMNFYKIL